MNLADKTLLGSFFGEQSLSLISRQGGPKPDPPAAENL